MPISLKPKALAALQVTPNKASSGVSLNKVHAIFIVKSIDPELNVEVRLVYLDNQYKFPFSLHSFELLFPSPVEQETIGTNSKRRSSFFIVNVFNLNVRKLKIPELT